MPGDQDILAKYGAVAVKTGAPEQDGDAAVLAKYGAAPVRAPASSDAAVLAKYGAAPQAGESPATEPSIGPADAASFDASKAAALKERFQQLPLGERVQRTLRRQFNEGLSTNLIAGVGRATGIESLQKPPMSDLDAQASLGTVGDLVTAPLAMVADPVGLGLFGAVGRAVTKVPGISRLFSSAAELMAERQAAQVAVKSLGEVAEDTYRAAARNYALNKIARSSVQGAAEFGAYNAASEAARQAADAEIDPMQFTKRTLEGFAFGGLLGPVVAGLKNERPELFGASRRAIVDDALKSQAEAAKPPRYAGQLDAQAKTLASEKQSVEEQLSSQFTKLDEVQRAKLEQRRDTTDRSLRDLVEPQKPEAPPSLDAAAQRAAQLSSNLEALKAERQGINAQREAVVRDPNRLVFSQDDHKLFAKLDKQAAALDGKIASTEEALGKTAERGSKGLERQAQNEAAYAADLNAHNDQLDALLTEKAAIEQGMQSHFISVPESSAGERAAELSGRLAAVEQQIAAVQAGKAETLQNFRGFLHSSGPLALQERLASRYETRPQFMDRAFSFADQESQRLVDRGAIKPEQKSGFAQAMFLEAVERKRLPIGQAGVSNSKWLRAFTQRAELFNTADKALGTRLVDTHYDLLQASTKLDHWNVEEAKLGHQLLQSLERKGLSGREVTELLTHVESAGTPGALPYFNPEPVQSKALTRPVYAGAIPADRVLQVYPELAQLRGELDRLHGMVTEGGRRDIGYVPGYVKLMPKEGVRPAPARGSVNVEKIINPAAYQERFGGQFDPSVHEDNPHVWFQAYVRDVNRDRAFAPLLPSVFKQMTLATWLGDRSGTAAHEFAKTVTKAMGLDTEAAMAQKFADHLATANESAVRAVMEKASLPPSAADEVIRGMRNVMYEAQVVLKLRNYMLDYLQPYLIGAAEVGAKNITRAYNALLFNKELRTFAKSFDHELLGADSAVTHEIGVSGPQTKIGKGLEKIVSLPGRVSGLRSLQGVTENVKRRVTFLAGYQQFKDAAAKGGGALIDRALDGLLEGERSRVLRLYRESGPEAAAQAYGIIRSYRANFALSSVNKPEALASGIGSLIPFTTWSSSQLARLATDVRRTHGFSHGIDFLTGERTAPTNTLQLAGRVGKAFAVLALIRAVTGQDIPSAHPVGDVARSFNWDVLPTVTQPLKVLAQAGPAAAGQSFLQNLPVAYQFTQYKKRYSDTGSRLSALLGTNPVYGTPAQRALSPLKELLKGKK